MLDAIKENSMRRLFKAVSPSPSVLISPEAALGRIQASQWLFRLLELSRWRKEAANTFKTIEI